MGVKSRSNYPVLVTICKKCKKFEKFCRCKKKKDEKRL